MHHRFFTLILIRLWFLVGLAQSVLSDETIPINTAASHDEYVYDARFSPDGSVLVTASGDNTAVVWATDSWQKRHILPHDAAVYSAAISSNGKAVVTGAGRVALWSAVTGQQLFAQKLHADAVYSVDFSADGTQRATAGGSTDGGDTVTRLWQVETLTVLREFSGHRRQVYGVRFSPDGQWLASASQDHTVRVWNCSSQQCVAILNAGRNPAYDVIFSSDDKSLFVVSGDGRLRTWRVSDFETLIEERRVVRSALYTIAQHPRNSSLVVAGESGQLFVLKEGFGESVVE